MTQAPGTSLTDAQRLDWLRLIRSENIGPRTFRSLINQFGGARAALDALPELVRRASAGRRIKIASLEECERELAAISRIGARLIALGESDYPAALRAVDAPPPLLIVRGQISLLQRHKVAIIGSRNASAAGLAFADRMAHDLAGANLIIVSGLARGIDARAHRASLKSGTIAVLAGGLDKIYPSEHALLLEQIIETGLAVSEMPMGWEARGRDFPRRNRIVSGLCLGTIVIEAARRSGSLITARFANEQGREVFAVPGSPLDPRAEGTNDLLRQGANICTGAADVLSVLEPLMAQGLISQRNLFEEAEAVLPPAEPLWDELDLFSNPPAAMSEPGHEFDEPQVTSLYQPPGRQHPAQEPAHQIEPQLSLREHMLKLLSPSPVPIDDLIRVMDAPVAAAKALLFELELEGLIHLHPGNLVAINPDRAKGTHQN